MPQPTLFLFPQQRPGRQSQRVRDSSRTRPNGAWYHAPDAASSLIILAVLNYTVACSRNTYECMERTEKKTQFSATQRLQHHAVKSRFSSPLDYSEMKTGRPLKRTLHLLIDADKSHAPERKRFSPLAALYDCDILA